MTPEKISVIKGQSLERNGEWDNGSYENGTLSFAATWTTYLTVVTQNPR